VEYCQEKNWNAARCVEKLECYKNVTTPYFIVNKYIREEVYNKIRIYFQILYKLKGKNLYDIDSKKVPAGSDHDGLHDCSDGDLHGSEGCGRFEWPFAFCQQK
jgi:hypothetical protein